MTNEFIVEMKAGDFNKEVKVNRRGMTMDVEHITKRIFLHLGAAAKEAGFSIDYFDTCEKIDLKLSYEGRVESATFESMSEMFKSVHLMVDNIIVVEN